MEIGCKPCHVTRLLTFSTVTLVSDQELGINIHLSLTSISLHHKCITMVNQRVRFCRPFLIISSTDMHGRLYLTTVQDSLDLQQCKTLNLALCKDTVPLRSLCKSDILVAEKWLWAVAQEQGLQAVICESWLLVIALSFCLCINKLNLFLKADGGFSTELINHTTSL